MNERIVELRNALGMTLKEFSSKIGMSLSGLSEVERGRSAVTERLIRLILAAFPQVSETWLRNGEGDIFVKSFAGHMDELIKRLDLPDIANTFVEVYESLPEVSREIVLGYAHKVIADLMAQVGANAVDQDAKIKADILKQYDLEKNLPEKSEDSPSIDTGTA